MAVYVAREMQPKTVEEPCPLFVSLYDRGNEEDKAILLAASDLKGLFWRIEEFLYFMVRKTHPYAATSSKVRFYNDNRNWDNAVINWNNL